MPRYKLKLYAYMTISKNDGEKPDENMVTTAALKLEEYVNSRAYIDVKGDIAAMRINIYDLEEI